MSIAQRLQHITSSIPDTVTLVAVSKTKPVEAIQEAYDAGQRVFGENKIQEMAEKQVQLPKDIEWHMIGHLQSNKVKYMAHFVDLIHGVDSFKTLKEINKQAKKHNRIIRCLLQAKIAQEETKFGLSLTDIQSILSSNELKGLENVQIAGLMGMASFTADMAQVKSEFDSISSLYMELTNQYNTFTTLSIGMSGDYQLAIEAGGNMIRVGSAIFGTR